MSGHRLQRVNEQLKREISRIVVGEVKDPRVDAVTVTDVSAAPDLTFARVRVQLHGSEDERATTLEGLEAATPFIRTALGQRIRMRRVPELRFEEDRSLERAMRIEELLAEAATGEDRDEDGEGDDPDTGAEHAAGDPDEAEGPGGAS